MKQPSYNLIILVIVLCAINSSYSQEKKNSPRKMIKAPEFFYLGKASGNDVIKMECEGQEPNYTDINCQFTQIVVTKKTEKELAEAKKQRKADYDKITLKEFNDVKKSYEQMKGEITKERRALLDSLTPEKKLYSKRLMTQFENISNCKSKEELSKLIEDFAEFDDKCCNIKIYTWKDSFQRISQFKWISNPGPQGLCNVVRVKTLETNDDYYLLWKYTEVTVSVDVDKKRNDLGDKICAEIELNKPVVYSWDIPTDFIPNCECIKYSW